MPEEPSRRSPLCFVVMPFGVKPNPTGGAVDFDRVYGELIQPAVRAADLEPLRADEERSGGMIHKPMLERLVLCEYAVADLTLANPNVLYELGVRHAVRPHTTVLVFARNFRLPFDVSPLRALPYDPDPSRLGSPEAREALTRALREARRATTDSPLFQLLEGIGPPDVSRLKTDVFRDQVAYSQRMKDAFGAARRDGVDAVDEVVDGLGTLSDVEAGVLVDALLSYRAVEAWQRMIELVERLPEPLARSVLVREQLAFALNRAGRSAEAERVLLALIEERGASSETYGLLGRVYKDRWQEARRQDQPHLAQGMLERAIDAYRKGFEADWRDAYPGINAVTLMALREPPDPVGRELLPVVRYSAQRRVADGQPDYWDFATLLEVAVLADDADEVFTQLGRALAAVREPWEPETTLNNVREIFAARRRRGDLPSWAGEVGSALEEARKRLAGGR